MDNNEVQQHFDIKEMSEQLLNLLPDMVLVKGPQSHILWANKAFQDYYGMTNEQLQGLLDSPISKPDFTQQYIIDDEKVFTTGQTLDIPAEPVTRYDGVVRYFHTVKTPIKNANGQVAMTLGISRDITEKRLAENNIQKSEERYRLVSKAISNVIWDWDIVEDKVTWSEGLRTIFKFSDRDLVTKSNWWFEHIHPEDLEQVKSSFSRIIESNDEFWIEHYRFQIGDSSYIDVEDKGYVVRDTVGKATRMIGAMVDVTHIKMSQAKIKGITENVPGMVYQFVLHPDGKMAMLYASPQGKDLYEVPAELIMQDVNSIINLTDPEYKDSLFKSIEESAKTLTPWRWEGKIHVASGKTKWIQGASTPAKHPSGDIIWDGLILDITERKQIEENLHARTQQLERFNDAMVGRELKMLELKEQNRKLEAKLGQLASSPNAIDKSS